MNDDKPTNMEELQKQIEGLNNIRRQIYRRMTLEMKLAIEKQEYDKIQEILARAKRDNDRVKELSDKIFASLGLDNLGFPR